MSQNMFFSPETGALLGALIGSTFGILGGLYGTIASRWAPMGKHRKYVLSIGVAFIVVSCLSGATGLVFLVIGQPRHVWYVFLLLGIIIPSVMIPTYLKLRKQYICAELNKMDMSDATNCYDGTSKDNNKK